MKTGGRSGFRAESAGGTSPNRHGDRKGPVLRHRRLSARLLKLSPADSSKHPLGARCSKAQKGAAQDQAAATTPPGPGPGAALLAGITRARCALACAWLSAWRGDRQRCRRGRRSVRCWGRRAAAGQGACRQVGLSDAFTSGHPICIWRLTVTFFFMFASCTSC